MPTCPRSSRIARRKTSSSRGPHVAGKGFCLLGFFRQIRDAFFQRHDAGLEREYAAAETPNADSADSQAEPQQCPASDSAAECAEPPAAPADSTRIVVKVSLDPRLKAKVLPGDTLFVFAKAADGPPMPLAIARLTAAQLPTSVTLTDAMSMMPNLTLSKFPQVILGARISKSGNAVAQSGDFQTLSAAVSNSRTEPIRLTIDRRVE